MNSSALWQDQLLKAFYVHFLDRSCCFTNMIGVPKHHCASFRGQRKVFHLWQQLALLNGHIWAPRDLFWCETQTESFSTWLLLLLQPCSMLNAPVCPRPRLPGHPIDSSLHLRTYLNSCRLPSRGSARAHTQACTCTPQRTKKPSQAL